jgi:hypothetical protein
MNDRDPIRPESGPDAAEASAVPPAGCSRRSTLAPWRSAVTAGLRFGGDRRAYREFLGEPPDAPWDTARSFDAIFAVAKARGIEVEF